MTELAQFTISRESELDREIETLIAKIVHGEATQAEREEFVRASNQRIRMMQVGSVHRHEERQTRLRVAG